MEHQPKLVSTDAGILLADFLDSLNDMPFTVTLCLEVRPKLVIGLMAMAK